MMNSRHYSHEYLEIFLNCTVGAYYYWAVIIGHNTNTWNM